MTSTTTTGTKPRAAVTSPRTSKTTSPNTGKGRAASTRQRGPDSRTEAGKPTAAKTAKTAETAEPVEKANANSDNFGATVLDETLAFLERFVLFPSKESAVIAAIWCALSHGLAASTIAPRLYAQSGEPGSGKTHLLEMLSLLCANSRLELDPTGPTVATVIALEQPTMFIDETDTIFGKSGSNAAKVQLRSILNSGYKRGAMLTRKSGKSYESIPVFAMIAFGGLGQLPDTLMSRSFVIRMRKRRETDRKIDAFRPRMHEAIGKATGAALGEWIKTQLVVLVNAWPDIPEGITNRAEEIAMPMLAIADAAGGHWPADARAAVRKLLLDEQDVAGPTPVETLLADIRAMWPEDGRTRLSTQELTFLLFQVESSPWRMIWDPVSASRELSNLLAGKHIAPRKVDLGGGKKLQGYRKEDFALAWASMDAKAEADSSGGSGSSEQNEDGSYTTEPDIMPDDDE